MTGAVLTVGGGFVVDLPGDIPAFHSVIDPADASASIVIKRDGTWTATGTAGGNWVTPRHATVGDLFDVKFDYTSGTPDVEAAADNTYIQINADRTWTENQTSIGSDVTSGSIYIGPTGLGTSLDSCTASLTAEVN